MGGTALGQGAVPASAPPPPPPPAGYPSGPLPRLLPVDPFPVAPGLGRTMTFQKPAGDDKPADSPASPLPKTGIPDSQSSPESGAKPGKGATGPAAQTPFQGAVNRDTAFRLQSDAQLNRRMVDELVKDATERATQNKTDRIAAKPGDYRFPEVQPVAPTGTTYVAKTVNYPPAGIAIEPSYVTHHRLYFEDKNTERYGWDLGIAQTFVSAATFYKDVFFLPAQIASHPHERYDTSAGKCRPGDPVPYYLYPPEIDIWGYAAQASTLVGAAFIFPR